MRWPSEIGVMVLPNVILFPQAFLPLYIFEPRYRRMLTHALETHRFFCVAMQRPDQKRESPKAIAGIGIIRAAREHADGTTHLILQGVARVQLGRATRYRPYRTHPIHVLPSQMSDTASADALAARLLELVADRLQERGASPLGVAGSVEIQTDDPSTTPPPGVEFLAHVTNPEQIADLVSWALLSSPGQRQSLLETLDVETRLRKLIQFLRSSGPASLQ